MCVLANHQRVERVWTRAMVMIRCDGVRTCFPAVGVLSTHAMSRRRSSVTGFGFANVSQPEDESYVPLIEGAKPQDEK